MARIDFLRRANSEDPPCNTLPDPWMDNGIVNGQNLDPCRQVEQICTSGPPIQLGTVSGALNCPSGNNPQGCCCSAAAYALLSACWVCQGHNPSDIDSGIQPSYEEFFHNSGCPDTSLFNIQLQPKGVVVSQWATLLPRNLSDHWNYTEAQIYGLTQTQQPGGLHPTTMPLSPSVMFSSSSTIPASSSSPASSRQSSSPGTVSGAVLGSLALASLISIGSCFVWRWRRRRVNRLDKVSKIDLTEPEMEGPSQVTDVTSGNPDPLRRTATFPFPYQGIVPRYHPNAPHSVEPSGTDARTLPDSDRDSRASRRHTAPVNSTRLPMDQLDRDLARLQGVEDPSASQVNNESHLGEGKGQVHHPYIHKTPRKRAASITTFTPSSNSGSANSRRARRKSGGEDAIRGRYFHLPPSAQYLANVARYPEKVDPERPWDIRRDGGTS